jgi:cobalt-zinc-cadmium resistance protein CzcA
VLYIVFEKGFGYFKIRRAAVLTIILISSGLHGVYAQQKISLNAAIDSALNHNASLEISKTQVGYHQTLQKSHFNVDKANAGLEYGNFNSKAYDNRVSISQTIQFPNVYRHQKSVNRTNLLISETALEQKQVEIKFRVKQTFYQLLVLQERRKLLQQADSVYHNFLEKATQRFKSGDVDLLERTTAENQRLQIANQQEVLSTDYQILLNEFLVLLNSKNLAEPASNSYLYESTLQADTADLSHNPLLKMREQEVQLSKQEYDLEKSRLLPSLTFGYSNSTIIGWQTTRQGSDLYFGGSKRFSSVNLGLGIPLFSGAQRSRISAANMMVKSHRQEVTATRQQLNVTLENALKLHAQSTRTVQSYKDVLLPNAFTIMRTSSLRLSAGEVGYLEWVILTNQAIQIRSEYFNAVQQLNDATFEIERITAIH